MTARPQHVWVHGDVAQDVVDGFVPLRTNQNLAHPIHGFTNGQIPVVVLEEIRLSVPFCGFVVFKSCRAKIGGVLQEGDGHAFPGEVFNPRAVCTLVGIEKAVKQDSERHGFHAKVGRDDGQRDVNAELNIRFKVTLDVNNLGWKFVRCAPFNRVERSSRSAVAKERRIRWGRSQSGQGGNTWHHQPCGEKHPQEVGHSGG